MATKEATGAIRFRRQRRLTCCCRIYATKTTTSERMKRGSGEHRLHGEHRLRGSSDWAEPHYGWADVVGDSAQLLSIQPCERPPGVYPSLDFGSSSPHEGPPDANPNLQ